MQAPPSARRPQQRTLRHTTPALPGTSPPRLGTTPLASLSWHVIEQQRRRLEFVTGIDHAEGNRVAARRRDHDAEAAVAGLARRRAEDRVEVHGRAAQR